MDGFPQDDRDDGDDRGDHVGYYYDQRWMIVITRLPLTLISFPHHLAIWHHHDQNDDHEHDHDHNDDHDDYDDNLGDDLIDNHILG